MSSSGEGEGSVLSAVISSVYTLRFLSGLVSRETALPVYGEWVGGSAHVTGLLAAVRPSARTRCCSRRWWASSWTGGRGADSLVPQHRTRNRQRNRVKARRKTQPQTTAMTIIVPVERPLPPPLPDPPSRAVKRNFELFRVSCMCRVESRPQMSVGRGKRRVWDRRTTVVETRLL